MLSRLTRMPAWRIQWPTSSCAFCIAADPNGRVMRSASSLHAASSSHLAMTVSALVTSAGKLGEGDLLGAFPEHEAAELAEVLRALGDGREMVAGKLPHLAGEDAGSVRKQDLRLAHPARIQEKMAGRRVAGVVLVAEVESQLAERDPCRLAAPASLDDLRLQRQHRLEFRAAPGRELGLEARDEAQPRDPDIDFYAREPMGVGAVDVRPTIWKT